MLQIGCSMPWSIHLELTLPMLAEHSLMLLEPSQRFSVFNTEIYPNYSRSVGHKLLPLIWVALA